MDKDRASIVQKAFARQAKAFARSPLQTDPERLRRLIRFMAPQAGETVLDVACGPGIVTGALAGEGLQALGIDLTDAMVREARARQAGGHYVRGDVARLPFRKGIFDIVVCRNSFHHLADPLAVAREMKRVTRLGGRVVIEDMRAPDDPVQREYHELIERLRDTAHERTLTRGEMLEVLAAAGLVPAREEPLIFSIDFEEWIDRAYPGPAARQRARAMLEACLEKDRCGLRVFTEAGRLKFERRSLLLGATHPA
ncbi:MAG TPA: class I SAM-dependent methyltransferase [Candidatus Polarisedimenticolia bacterium]|nr:class I SAM-dependent methyltransferase [Candidatus Polarisedimenticolia bacterium]